MTARVCRSEPGRLARLRGFTLLELLVVLALLSVVMLAMGAALRAVAQSEVRVDDRLARADEFRVAVGFIRSTMGRVSGQKVQAPAEAGASPFLFAAGPDAVAWVGVMPARYGAGGRSFFRLGMEPVGGDAALVLRFMPWEDVNTFPDWSQAQAKVLVANVTAFSVRYEDDRDVPPAWLPEWPHADRMPARLSVSIQTAHGDWPSLVVALRQFPSSSSSGDGFVIGGTPR